jgi:ribonuclease BN (tRNA processing enzyme)
MGSPVSIGVTVLGSSGMFATTERACSGYLLQFDDTVVWMDAGAGSWRNLLRYVDYPRVDAIVLSHRHPDHTTDVYQAFHARHYGGLEPLEPIPLWAPAETLERLCGFGKEIQESFDLQTIAAGGALEIAGARFSFVAMVHPAETVGMRVERDGVVVAYSADTGPDADMAALARGADVFICEATLQDSDEPWSGHTSASVAGAIAADLGVGRLLLTHLPPGRDPALSLEQARGASADVPVQLAEDCLRFEVA